MVDYINTQSPAEAWIKSCFLLASKGKRCGNNIEIENLIIEIRNPLLENRAICELYIQQVGEEYLKRVRQLMFSTKSLRWKTSYRSRLVSWNNDFDQLAEVLSRMKKKPKSKTLTCIVTNPQKDLRRVRAIPASMPCITAIDFRIRENLLNMTVYFRSQDVFRIGYPDYTNLSKFLEEIHGLLSSDREFCTKKKPVNIGKITCHIVSAFIRFDDLKLVQKINHVGA